MAQKDQGHPRKSSRVSIRHLGADAYDCPKCPSFCDSDCGGPEPSEDSRSHRKSIRGAGVGRQGPGQVHGHGAKGHGSRSEPHPASFSVGSRGAP